MSTSTKPIRVQDDFSEHQQMIDTVGAYDADSVTTDYRQNIILFPKFWEAQRELVHLIVTMRVPLFYLIRGELLAWTAVDQADGEQVDGASEEKADRLEEPDIRVSLYSEVRLPTLAPKPSTAEALSKHLRKGVFGRHETIKLSRMLAMWFENGAFNDASGENAAGVLKEWLLDHASCRIYLMAVERTLESPKIPNELLPPRIAASPDQLNDIVDALRRQANKVQDLRALITTNNIRLVPRGVNKMATLVENCALTSQDLMGFAHDGLIDAVDKFDPRKNTRFSTLAVGNIKGYIQRGINNHAMAVRQPVHVRLLRTRINAWAARNDRPGHEPKPEEICAAMNITRRQYDRAMEAENAVSLDETLGSNSDGDDKTTLHNLMEAEGETPRDSYESAETYELVRQVFNTQLTPVDKLITSFMTGIDYPESGLAYLRQLIESGFGRCKETVSASGISRAVLLAKPATKNGR